MTSTSMHPTPRPLHPTRDAVRAGDYERAALRLVYGFLVALDETAPQAREELLHLMVERTSRRETRGWTGGEATR